MGRELKRVPLNFQWEIGKLWKGFVNPHEYHQCDKCDGGGYSREYERLKNIWYGWHDTHYVTNPYKPNSRYNPNAWSNNLTKEDVEVLVKGGRLTDVIGYRSWYEEKENTWYRFKDSEKIKCDAPTYPTPEEVNEWNLKSFMGHDSVNAYVVIKAKCIREGKNHECDKCGGSGEYWRDEEAKNLYQNWEEYPPPKGEGFQLWSTTTEGHPMTPVLSTLEDLCKHLESAKVPLFGRSTASYQRWFDMLSEGFVRHETDVGVFI
jgi:hypothetical protein